MNGVKMRLEKVEGPAEGRSQGEATSTENGTDGVAKPSKGNVISLFDRKKG
jgi:hypothetical protein